MESAIIGCLLVDDEFTQIKTRQNSMSDVTTTIPTIEYQYVIAVMVTR